MNVSDEAVTTTANDDNDDGDGDELDGDVDWLNECYFWTREIGTESCGYTLERRRRRSVERDWEARLRGVQFSTYLSLFAARPEISFAGRDPYCVLRSRGRIWDRRGSVERNRRLKRTWFLAQ